MSFCSFVHLVTLAPPLLRANTGTGLRSSLAEGSAGGLCTASSGVPEWISLSTTHFVQPVHPLLCLMVSKRPLWQKHLWLQLLAMFGTKDPKLVPWSCSHLFPAMMPPLYCPVKGNTKVPKNEMSLKVPIFARALNERSIVCTSHSSLSEKNKRILSQTHSLREIYQTGGRKPVETVGNLLLAVSKIIHA